MQGWDKGRRESGMYAGSHGGRHRTLGLCCRHGKRVDRVVVASTRKLLKVHKSFKVSLKQFYS